MKKKILITLLSLLFVLHIQASGDNDSPIRIDQLPKPAQEFVQKHFPGMKVALAKVEKELFTKSYQVIFTNGNKVEFNGSGKWIEVKCKYDEVPSSVLPAPIARYVAQHYPKVKVWKIETDEEKKLYEVKLSNRIELEFDMKGNLIHIDHD